MDARRYSFRDEVMLFRTRIVRNTPTLFAMAATQWTLGCDANDPHRLADFWPEALGYVAERGYDDPDGASIIDLRARVLRSDGCAYLRKSRRRTGSTSTSACW